MKIVKLSDYIEEYSEKNKDDRNIPVYSVTNEEGFCTGYFSKEVASKDRRNYKVVPYGFFAYNPSRINVGSIDWQRNEEKVIVSPLYVVFKVKEKVNQQYLLYYLKSDVAKQYIVNMATGSVRNNLKFSDLGEIPFKLYDLREQKEIVGKLDRVFKLIDEVKLAEKKLDELVKSRFMKEAG